jgi:hypothetical protein
MAGSPGYERQGPGLRPGNGTGTGVVLEMGGRMMQEMMLENDGMKRRKKLGVAFPWALLPCSPSPCPCLPSTANSR